MTTPKKRIKRPPTEEQPHVQISSQLVDELATRYEQAFLAEKAAREEANVAIQRLRKAEKELSAAAQAIADKIQTEFPFRIR